MKYGICNLGIVPVRSDSSDKSEQTSQLIYGEIFSILQEKSKWSKIKLTFDDYSGWIDNKQFKKISEEEYKSLNGENQIYSYDLVEFVENTNHELIAIPIGSNSCTSESTSSTSSTVISSFIIMRTLFKLETFGLSASK